MPKDKNTEAGAVDDNAVKRAKKRNQTLQDIFDDNKSGRPQDPDGRD